MHGGGREIVATLKAEKEVGHERWEVAPAPLAGSGHEQ